MEKKRTKNNRPKGRKADLEPGIDTELTTQWPIESQPAVHELPVRAS